MGLIGAHVSIAGGLHRAIERGEALGCEAIQLFAQSSRTWKTCETTDEEIRLFSEARRRSRLRSIVAHNSYLLNLSTASADLRKKSVRYFIENLERCEAFGIDALVTHPGSHLGAGLESGIAMTALSLGEVLAACRGFRARILLENTAGQGDCIGHDLEDLARIVDKCPGSEQVGFCFDTQHAFAAGYDLRTRESYEATMEKVERTLGVKRVLAFHVNDATKDLGCRVDRHENLGMGRIGRAAFGFLVNDPRFRSVPMCVETAPGENDAWHKADLRLLRKLRDTGPSTGAARAGARGRRARP